MSQKVNKSLRDIARNLPDVYIKKPTSKIVTKRGRKYVVKSEETVKADHEARLKALYKKGGNGAVLKYVMHAKAVGHNQAQFPDKIKKEINPNPLQKAIKWVKHVYNKIMSKWKA